MKKRNQKIVMIDIDDTLVDTAGALEKELQSLYGGRKRPYLTNSVYWNPKSKYYNICQVILDKEYFYAEKVQLKENAAEAIELLNHNRFLVLLVTAERGNMRMVHKEKMLKRLLPDFDIENGLIRMRDKSLIRAHYHIDDCIENLEASKEYMETIILNSPSNQNYDGRRALDLLDAYSYIVADMF